MIEKKFFKVIGMFLCMIAFFCLTSSNVKAEAKKDYTVVKLHDSSAWEGDATLETIGLNTSVGGVAVYNSQPISNEIVQFKASFSLDPNDGWVGMKFRSNLPYNQVWDNNQCYMIMVRLGKIEVLKVKDKVTTSITSADFDLNDNKEHEIQAGVYDTSGGAILIFNVDGKSVINYMDKDPVPGESVFSLNTYQNNTKVKVTVYPDPNNDIEKQIERPIAVEENSISAQNQWFVNNYVGMGDEQGLAPTLEKSKGQIKVTAKGGVTYKNSLDCTAFSFDLSVNKRLDSSEDVSTIVFFRKLNRDTIYGDSSYGVKISSSGKISFVKYTANKMKVYPAYETGVDFSKPQTIKVEVVPVSDVDAEIYIYLNSDSLAYKYVDHVYNPNLEPPGFFGVYNCDENAVTTIGNIQFTGSEINYSGESETVLPVYFADYMMESGNKFLHWVYRPDYPNYMNVEVSDENGNIIGTTDYPKNTYILPKDHQYTKLYLTAVNIDGNRSDKVLVDLLDKHSDYYSSKVEQIVIKPGDTKADFITKDSKQVFVMNGVNYVGLRYGDHATFEPEIGAVGAKYDPYTVETMFKELKKNGYNTVRVFILGGRKLPNRGLGGFVDATNGLYIPYMENVFDFIKRAHKYGIYVMPNFSENEMISNEYFKTLANNASSQGILFSKDGIAAKQQYLKLFLEYIKQRDPEIMASIIAMEMQNEFAFSGNQAPFDKTTGTYTFLDGQKFDMSNQDQRRELANAAITNYYKQMKEAITSVVPDMLLSEGTFTMLGVGKNYNDNKGIMPVANGDSRYPMTAIELLKTDIDFLDMHIYRYGATGNGQEVFEKNYNNMLLDTEEAKHLIETKPIILGEYGAMLTDQPEQDFDTAMKYCMVLRDEAMKHEFSGALFWTIDSFEQTTMWSLMDQNGKYLKELSLLKPEIKVETKLNVSEETKSEDPDSETTKITESIVAMDEINQSNPVNMTILISCITFLVAVLIGSGIWLVSKKK